MCLHWRTSPGLTASPMFQHILGWFFSLCDQRKICVQSADISFICRLPPCIIQRGIVILCGQRRADVCTLKFCTLQTPVCAEKQSLVAWNKSSKRRKKRRETMERFLVQNCQVLVVAQRTLYKDIGSAAFPPHVVSLESWTSSQYKPQKHWVDASYMDEI